MEVNDSIFEFVFPDRLRQDGSGEKGFEVLDLNFVFHVERERPPVFPAEVSLFQTPRCVLASKKFFRVSFDRTLPFSSLV